MEIRKQELRFQYFKACRENKNCSDVLSIQLVNPSMLDALIFHFHLYILNLMASVFHKMFKIGFSFICSYLHSRVLRKGDCCIFHLWLPDILNQELLTSPSNLSSNWHQLTLNEYHRIPNILQKYPIGKISPQNCEQQQKKSP